MVVMLISRGTCECSDFLVFRFTECESCDAGPSLLLLSKISLVQTWLQTRRSMSGGLYFYTTTCLATFQVEGVDVC